MRMRKKKWTLKEEKRNKPTNMRRAREGRGT
jgi:hypothetical protein